MSTTRRNPPDPDLTALLQATLVRERLALEAVLGSPPGVEPAVVPDGAVPANSSPTDATPGSSR